MHFRGSYTIVLLLLLRNRGWCARLRGLLRHGTGHAAAAAVAVASALQPPGGGGVGGWCDVRPRTTALGPPPPLKAQLAAIRRPMHRESPTPAARPRLGTWSVISDQWPVGLGDELNIFTILLFFFLSYGVNTSSTAVTRRHHWPGDWLPIA